MSCILLILVPTFENVHNNLKLHGYIKSGQGPDLACSALVCQLFLVQTTHCTDEDTNLPEHELFWVTKQPVSA